MVGSKRSRIVAHGWVGKEGQCKIGPGTAGEGGLVCEHTDEDPLFLERTGGAFSLVLESEIQGTCSGSPSLYTSRGFSIMASKQTHYFSARMDPSSALPLEPSMPTCLVLLGSIPARTGNAIQGRDPMALLLVI
jgi:hypothetical protein